jgi:hypothetical protein
MPPPIMPTAACCMTASFATSLINLDVLYAS